jgi:hypothetical protein
MPEKSKTHLKKERKQRKAAAKHIEEATGSAFEGGAQAPASAAAARAAGPAAAAKQRSKTSRK